MCRRYTHARAQRSDLAKLFSVDCEKKKFLSERNVLHFLTREEYLFTYRVSETDNARKEKDTPHIRTRWCALFSLFSLQSDICALIT